MYPQVGKGPGQPKLNKSMCGHMGNPCEQTHMIENITFPQLCWPVVNIQLTNY